MNAGTGLELPPGTTIISSTRGLILNLSWESRVGTHIVRLEVPYELCDPVRRALLCDVARDFRRAAQAEGFPA